MAQVDLRRPVNAPLSPVEAHYMINLDFDADDRLIGIEILGASEVLLPEILGEAESTG